MVTEVELAAHLDALRTRLSDLETDVRELARSVDIIEEFLDETLNIRWCHPELQVQQKPLPVKEEACYAGNGWIHHTANCKGRLCPLENQGQGLLCFCGGQNGHQPESIPSCIWTMP